NLAILTAMAIRLRPAAIMTSRAHLSVKLLTALLAAGIDFRKQVLGPAGRGQAFSGFRSGQQSFHFVDDVEPHRRFMQVLRGTGQLYRGPHAHGFGDIAAHGLPDRTIVLHPVEPGSVPETGIAD